MPAEHPGVIQFELVGWSVYIPSIPAVELIDLHQAVVQVIFRSWKSEMMAHSLSHGCEEDPVVGVRAFTVDLREPGDDLCLLGRGHFIEDTLAAHPNGHCDIGAFYDALIQITDISPVG